MPRIDELRLMTKVARLYYERGLRQAEIAAQLHLSQATVSRLLKHAEQEKIVRITVSAPHGTYPKLEEALQEKYGLQDAIIVDAVRDDEQQIQRDLGAAAAFYVESTLNTGEVVGISSWSGTLLAMVDAMHTLPRSTDTQVIQILGGVGNPAAEVHAAHLTGRLAALVRGHGVLLAAPGIVGSADTARILCADSFVRDTLALFDQVTMALVGIGAVEPSGLLASSGNVFSPEELNRLRQQGAVGDILLRFFNAEGVPVITPLDERVIGMSLEQLRHVKRSVGIAGGQRKLAAIRGALVGGWINTLITDRFTAGHLVSEE